MTGGIVVIGLGNSYRGDDGVGLAAACDMAVAVNGAAGYPPP